MDAAGDELVLTGGAPGEHQSWTGEGRPARRRGGDVITVEEAERGSAATRRETAAHFRLRLVPLTDLQQAFMRAAASLGDDGRTLGRVATALGTTSGRLASTTRSLDERHRLIRRAAGRITIRSPGLVAHLRAEAAP